MEVLTGRKPNVKHLRIFGSEAWIHVKKNFRKKLHAKAKRGIVLRSLGYGKYSVWDIDAKRAYDTRHAVINENIFPATEWRANQANRVAVQRWYSDLCDELEPDNAAARFQLTNENGTSDASESEGKFDEDSLIDSIPSDVPDLIEEDNEVDEDQEVSDTGSEQFLDALTYTPSPNEDISGGDRRYP